MRRGAIRSFAAALRAWWRVRDFAIEAAGILGCLVLFLPLVPVFRMFEDIGRAIRDE